MQQTTYKEQKPSRRVLMSTLIAATAVILVLIVTPWNLFPTAINEDVTVIAVADYGCVAESALGYSVVVPNCDARVGETISASFNVPAMEVNGFYERAERNLGMIFP